MTDQPIREPIQPDPERDRRDVPDADEDRRADAAPVRPSKAEGAEETGGQRPPRPSQAEGEREETDE